MSLIICHMLVRPAVCGVLPRPLLCRYLPHPSFRAFSASALQALQDGQPYQASTALKADVRERESAADTKLVGSEGKGA
ncbi:hypothetical protein JCM24511_09519 [Saitozyma sp. JCM 24511]|nr:hypothetical protein JCM24511_09519 [Saitozyma sp. JCM 24511]